MERLNKDISRGADHHGSNSVDANETSISKTLTLYDLENFSDTEQMPNNHNSFDISYDIEKGPIVFPDSDGEDPLLKLSRSIEFFEECFKDEKQRGL